jgi:hypothetical protein
MAQPTAEQITERTQQAMENYFNWLQNTMSAFPWGHIDLNRRLLGDAAESVTVTFAFLQKLSQAKNLEDLVKIQTEFINAQMNLLNERAMIVRDLYAKAAEAATKMSSAMST